MNDLISNNMYWRNIEPVNIVKNPGFQFVGSTDSEIYDTGYSLTPETAFTASQNVEWMYDQSTGLVHEYARFQYAQLTNAVAQKGLSADDEAYGSDANDLFSMGSGDDKIYGRGGDDWINGGEGADLIDGQDGDDTLIGGPGSDLIYGGAGYDAAALDGLNGAGFQLFKAAYSPNTVYAADVRNQFLDTIVEVEVFRSFDQSVKDSLIAVFDPFSYAASRNNLTARFRLDADAATSYYLAEGVFAGDEKVFDVSQYLKNYTDLSEAFGQDYEAATRHFLTNGFDEQRLADDSLEYIASFTDLMQSFNGASQETLIAKGLEHYREFGFAEGRRDTIDFETQQYLKNYEDLRVAFGEDENAAATHFINSGFAEHRLAANPLLYIASSDDLIESFGQKSSAEQIIQSGLAHYATNGFHENRTVSSFSIDAYLNRYEDLRIEFADGQGGYDENAATLHYIMFGYTENRSYEWLVV